MAWKVIESKDKKVFDRFLNLKEHWLSAYAFENIYIWRGLFDIRWQIIQGQLCVFFNDRLSCFMYLAPLGEVGDFGFLKEAFAVMDRFNKNKAISRIENVEECDLVFFKNLGYECVSKSPDYLCRRSEMVRLPGDTFKSKRWAYNYFVKNYTFKYLPFSLRHQEGCLKLYRHWMASRKQKNSDHLYLGMLEDSLTTLKILFKDYPRIKCLGRVVKIDGKIKAFTFGFKLNSQTFCILYEVTDLAVKGLAQFIFRKFCSELKNFHYFNIMDDSGLENLKNLKLSYHPVKLIPAFIVQRKNEHQD